MTTVLTASSDLRTLNHLQQVLTREDFVVLTMPHLDNLRNTVSQYRPDALVIDISSYDVDGIDFCFNLRDEVGMEEVPLLLLTSVVDAPTAAALLDAGADDLLRKPFAERELLARLRALLRWSQLKDFEDVINLRLVAPQNVVYVDHRRVLLTPVEFQLLHFLCDNRSRYFSADDLLSQLWNYPPDMGDTALVRNHIRNLRRKLEFDPDHPRVLVSRYGQGYTIQAVVQQS